MAKVQSAARPLEDPFGNHSLLDNIIHGVFGHPTDEMDPKRAREVESQRAAGRQDASAMARSAMANPGEAYMGPPALSGKGANVLDIIGSIGKLFQSGGGL